VQGWNLHVAHHGGDVAVAPLQVHATTCADAAVPAAAVPTPTQRATGTALLRPIKSIGLACMEVRYSAAGLAAWAPLLLVPDAVMAGELNVLLTARYPPGR
jgi:hypothetical protein